MTYQLSLQAPEAPIREEWMWTTDLQTAYAGDEARTPLLRYPKRLFSGTFEFSRVEDVRRHMAFMFHRGGAVFKFPLYQYQTKLKAAVAAGAGGVSVNAHRSDFRVGLLALIVDGDVFEEVEIDAVTANSVSFLAPLVNAYSARAIICPLTVAYTETGAAFSRRAPDGTAMASFRYLERDPWAPFVSPLNEVDLTFFDGMAVVDSRAVGVQFDSMLDSGIRITTYLGRPDVFNPRDQAQWAFPQRWLVNRQLDPEAWYWWQTFADHIQGASTPFLLASQRADLEIVTPAVGAGDTLVVAGNEYSQHYFDSDTFKRVVVSSDAGRHYATVTGVASLGGDDQLTLSPALPAGAGWATNQQVEFLLKVRNADDKIVCDHYGLQTEIAMSLRTVA